MIPGTVDYILWGDLNNHADAPNRKSGKYEVMSCLGQGGLR